VTACGNFAIAGSSIGQISMWNLQSGIKRKTFKLGLCPPEAATRLNTGSARLKERSISGIATDSLNKYVIVATLDGTVNVGLICEHP
jgi:U3 small nucleolar RNA-associated protein 21